MGALRAPKGRACRRRLWPPDGGGLCSLRSGGESKKVLKIDRPLAGGFLSLTALRAEGFGIALRAMSIYAASAAVVGGLYIIEGRLL